MSDVDSPGFLRQHPERQRSLTVLEYRRLGEAGILGADERVELIAGQLATMSPIGPRHALAVDALRDVLGSAVAGRAAVRVQNPVTLDDNSEPIPDITVVQRPWTGFPHSHPGPSDVHLLIEVADTTLNYDNGAKLELYARAGIREVWILDLTTDVVLVYREPKGLSYAHSSRVKPSGVLDIAALPDVAVQAAALFT